VRDHLSRGCTLNAYNDYNNIIIVCIVHAHVAFNIAYNIIMPNIQPPPPPKLLLLLLLSSTSFMCTLFRLYPTRVPICVCVCESARSRYALYTHDSLLLSLRFVYGFYSSVFFPSSCYLVF